MDSGQKEGWTGEGQTGGKGREGQERGRQGIEGGWDRRGTDRGQKEGGTGEGQAGGRGGWDRHGA